MNTQASFSDEYLTAFLDGEASDALHAAIQSALEADPTLADRLSVLDVPLAPIVAAYDTLLETAPPMPTLSAAQNEPEPTTHFGWGWGIGTFATGLAAGLAVAVFAGFAASEPAPPAG